ncbi:MAG: IS66 family insertion sequence element accessory protein TnpA [Rhodanobacteraceae bacterium]
MWTRRDWPALLAEQARSRLTQAAFCAQHGIYPANLRRARLRLEARAMGARAVTAAVSEPFVQVVPAALPDAPLLELAFGALTLRFAPSTAPRVVAALVKALA